MTNPPSTSVRGRGFRLAARTVLTTATAAAFVGAASLSASAAPGDEVAGVTANVAVNSALILTMDPSFTITGDPGDTVAGSVDGNVLTNDPGGYTVSVATTATNLVPAGQNNADLIPIDALEVRDSTTAFQSVGTASVETNTKGTRSGANGDNFTDDYQITIPNVAADTYSATLNYTAAAVL